MLKMTFQTHVVYNFNHSYNLCNQNDIDINSQSFISTVRSDEQFVKKYNILSNTPSVSNVNKRDYISIPGIQKSLNNISNICDNISNLETVLRDNVANINNTEWSESIKRISMWENEISNELIIRESNLTGDIKRKLKRAVSKRKRLRRRKGELKLKNREENKFNKLQTEDIDLKIQKIKNQLEINKEEEEFKLLVDNVLKDVNKRKAAARKYLLLLDALMKLRSAREKSALGRGEKVNNQESQEFAYNIGKLKELWSSALCEYSAEEINMRQKLETLNVTEKKCLPLCNENDTNTEKDIKLWRYTLFGSEELMPQRDFQQDFHNFCNVRRRWDHYLSNSEDASTLPVGWVVPQSNKNNNWDIYQEHKIP